MQIGCNGGPALFRSSSSPKARDDRPQLPWFAMAKLALSTKQRWFDVLRHVVSDFSFAGEF
jgi:hypothetical protein